MRETPRATAQDDTRVTHSSESESQTFDSWIWKGEKNRWRHALFWDLFGNGRVDYWAISGQHLMWRHDHTSAKRHTTSDDQRVALWARGWQDFHAQWKDNSNMTSVPNFTHYRPAVGQPTRTQSISVGGDGRCCKRWYGRVLTSTVTSACSHSRIKVKLKICFALEEIVRV